MATCWQQSDIDSPCSQLSSQQNKGLKLFTLPGTSWSRWSTRRGSERGPRPTSFSTPSLILATGTGFVEVEDTPHDKSFHWIWRAVSERLHTDDDTIEVDPLGCRSNSKSIYSPLFFFIFVLIIWGIFGIPSLGHQVVAVLNGAEFSSSSTNLVRIKPALEKKDTCMPPWLLSEGDRHNRGRVKLSQWWTATEFHRSTDSAISGISTNDSHMYGWCQNPFF